MTLGHVDEGDAISETPQQFASQRGVLTSGQTRIPANDLSGVVAGLSQELYIRSQVSDFELGKTVLAGTQQLSRASQTQILLGDAKAVARASEDLQSSRDRGRGVGE